MRYCKVFEICLPCFCHKFDADCISRGLTIHTVKPELWIKEIVYEETFT